jgi:Asp-tRNA(Asn)/Glu-tRNA(Gln) amidotransferase A subunit family amidase
VTAVEAAVRLARGAANSVKLVEHCLARIAARDGALLATFVTITNVTITKSSMFTKSSRPF